MPTAGTAPGGVASASPAPGPASVGPEPAGPSSGVGRDANPPGLERVDELLVVATVRRIPHQFAEDALVIRMAAPPEERLPEGRVLLLVASVASGLGSASLWNLDVLRSHAGAGPQTLEGRAVVRLDLVAPSADFTAARQALTDLTARLHELRPAQPRAVDRDEAVARARQLVEVVWEVPGRSLQVSDEEHVGSPPGWAVGLVGEDLTRYRVLVGYGSGDPHIARLGRHGPTEVADSVGE